MTKRRQINLPPNGNGAQPFIGPDLLDDSACPIDVGQTVTATVIRGVGILITEPQDDREYRVEIEGRADV